MAILLARKKFIIAGLEGTYGVDPTPTQAIQTSNLQIRPLLGPKVSRNLDRASLGNELEALVGSYVGLSFEVQLAGSGTAGTAPAFGELLLACGMSETLVAVTSATYKPVSTDFDSVTIYFKHDGQQHILTGARGSVAINADAASIGHLVFDFMGIYNAPTSTADGTPDFSAFEDSLPVNNLNTTSFSLHGAARVMQRFSFDLACQRDYENLVGDEAITLYDRLPAGSTTIRSVAISDKNWFETARLNTLDALSLVHGTVAGNIVTLSAPKVGIKDPEYTGDKTSMTQLGLTFLQDTGDDEVSLAFT